MLTVRPVRGDFEQSVEILAFEPRMLMESMSLSSRSHIASADGEISMG
jgi:hypothetical protein